MAKKTQEASIKDEIFQGKISDGQTAQIKQLLKDYNGRALLPGLNPTFFEEHDSVLPTGCLTIDDLTFVDGLPTGKMVQVWGKPSAHKSTLCLSMVGRWQKQGLVCAWVDAEFRFDYKYAAKCGVDLSSLIFMLPDSGEDALDFIVGCARGAANVIVLDSAGCLGSASAEDKSVGKAGQMGETAHMLNNMIQRNTGKIFWSKAVVVIINQVRAKQSTPGMSMMGPQYAPPGGWKLSHTWSLSLKLDKIGTVKENGRKVGADVKITVDKSSVGPDGYSDVVRFMSDPETNRFGLQFGDDLVRRGLEFNILKKTGGKIAYGEVTLGRSRSEAAMELDKNIELSERVYKDIWEMMKEEKQDVYSTDEDETSDTGADTDI